MRSLDFTSRINSQKSLQLFLFFFHRLRNENRVRSPDFLGISEELPLPTSHMKDDNLLLEENKYHVDENELATSEEWKLPYKNLRLEIYYVR